MWLKYSDKPINRENYLDREQPGPREDGYVSDYEKPRGCWITDDSDECWRSWCLSERFNLEGLTHKHEVILDEASVLILRSVYELDQFNKEFGMAYWWNGRSVQRYRNWYIDWPRVAKSFAGLIITPYQWERRIYEGFNWYYGWDCASGCIWKADAIKEIRLLEINPDIASREAA